MPVTFRRRLQQKSFNLSVARLTAALFF